MLNSSRVEQSRRINRVIRAGKRTIRPVDMPDDMKPLSNEAIRATASILFSQLPEEKQAFFLAMIQAEVGIRA